MNPRSEPLLWLQLIALGAVPLELLLLLLLLAGADPGPFPWLERSL
ncbi:MAG: low-complexity tail membrane protein, partial [Cyanobium sp.]|nr:low-complexity tail membrane protein [Cyanobium sp.]